MKFLKYFLILGFALSLTSCSLLSGDSAGAGTSGDANFNLTGAIDASGLAAINAIPSVAAIPSYMKKNAEGETTSGGAFICVNTTHLFQSLMGMISGESVDLSCLITGDFVDADDLSINASLCEGDWMCVMGYYNSATGDFTSDLPIQIPTIEVGADAAADIDMGTLAYANGSFSLADASVLSGYALNTSAEALAESGRFNKKYIMDIVDPFSNTYVDQGMEINLLLCGEQAVIIDDHGFRIFDEVNLISEDEIELLAHYEIVEGANCTKKFTEQIRMKFLLAADSNGYIGYGNQSMINDAEGTGCYENFQVGAGVNEAGAFDEGEGGMKAYIKSVAELDSSKTCDNTIIADATITKDNAYISVNVENIFCEDESMAYGGPMMGPPPPMYAMAKSFFDGHDNVDIVEEVLEAFGITVTDGAITVTTGIAANVGTIILGDINETDIAMFSDQYKGGAFGDASGTANGHDFHLFVDAYKDFDKSGESDVWVMGGGADLFYDGRMCFINFTTDRKETMMMFGDNMGDMGGALDFTADFSGSRFMVDSWGQCDGVEKPVIIESLYQAYLAGNGILDYVLNLNAETVTLTDTCDDSVLSFAVSDYCSADELIETSDPYWMDKHCFSNQENGEFNFYGEVWNDWDGPRTTLGIQWYSWSGDGCSVNAFADEWSRRTCGGGDMSGASWDDGTGTSTDYWEDDSSYDPFSDFDDYSDDYDDYYYDDDYYDEHYSGTECYFYHPDYCTNIFIVESPICHELNCYGGWDPKCECGCYDYCW